MRISTCSDHSYMLLEDVIKKSTLNIVDKLSEFECVHAHIRVDE